MTRNGPSTQSRLEEDGYDAKNCCHVGVQCRAEHAAGRLRDWRISISCGPKTSGPAYVSPEGIRLKSPIFSVGPEFRKQVACGDTID